MMVLLLNCWPYNVCAVLRILSIAVMACNDSWLLIGVNVLGCLNMRANDSMSWLFDEG